MDGVWNGLQVSIVSRKSQVGIVKNGVIWEGNGGVCILVGDLDEQR